jgi:hypothetical protein
VGALRALIAALACFVVLLAARSGSTTRQAVLSAQELRWALLSAPEPAARDFCAARAAAPCPLTLSWRAGGGWSDLCSDLTVAARPGAVAGESRFRARRYYRIQSRCVFRIGAFTLPLPPLTATFAR